MNKVILPFLIVTNIITLLAVYYVYNIGRSQDSNTSCYSCPTDDLHGETAAEFLDVTARYRSAHQTLYNQYVKGNLSNAVLPQPSVPADEAFLDARSCWFAADTLKKFICLMEKYASKADISNMKFGVRFYYATYSDTISNKAYARHHTLYLVPTIFVKEENAHIDFEPRESAREGKIVFLKDILYPDKIKDKEQETYQAQIDKWNTRQLFITSPTIVSPAATVSMNQGDLCPPGTGCNFTIRAIDATYPGFHW